MCKHPSFLSLSGSSYATGFTPLKKLHNCPTARWVYVCLGGLSYFNEAHKTFEIASSLHSMHMNHCSVVTLPVEQETERDTKEERK